MFFMTVLLLMISIATSLLHLASAVPLRSMVQGCKLNGHFLNYNALVRRKLSLSLQHNTVDLVNLSLIGSLMY